MVWISVIPRFLADSLIETAHEIQLVDPSNAANPLIILLQLSGITSYFDACSLRLQNMRIKTF